MDRLMHRCKLDGCYRQKHSKGVRGVTAVFLYKDQTLFSKVIVAVCGVPHPGQFNKKTVIIVCAVYIYSFKTGSVY